MRCITGRDHREFIARRIKPGSRVLEWGSGGSTLWLAEHLPDGAHLTSIEHHPEWFQTVRTKLGDRPHVTLIHAPADGPLGANATIAEEDPAHLSQYIRAADGQTFDVIIVDGVARTACMQHAASLLAPDGTIFLHDAHRDWYDDGKARFIEHATLGSCPDYPGPLLWSGGLTPHTTTMSPASAPLIVSFYTEGTPYEEEAKNLRRSCREVGAEYLIEGRPSAGSWERNCALKARFIKECSDLTTRPVLWVDADAVLRRPPVLLGGGEMDFAVHKCRRWQFASGTVYFNRTACAQHLLDHWVQLCGEFPDVWDQILLDAAWERVTARHPLRTQWLPPSYTKIFDLDSDAAHADEGPVIEHYQASRRHKSAVSSGSPPRVMPDPDNELVASRKAARPRACWYDERFVLLPEDPSLPRWIHQHACA